MSKIVGPERTNKVFMTLFRGGRLKEVPRTLARKYGVVNYRHISAHGECRFSLEKNSYYRGTRVRLQSEKQTRKKKKSNAKKKKFRG